LMRLSFFLQRYPPPRAPHPSPTRRSSDLGQQERQGRRAADPARRRGGPPPLAGHEAPGPPCLAGLLDRQARPDLPGRPEGRQHRSEEHTSELQSLTNLVCRLLLEKKKTQT